MEKAPPVWCFLCSSWWFLLNGKRRKKGFRCNLSPTPLPPKTAQSRESKGREWLSRVECAGFVNNNFLIHPIIRQRGQKGLVDRSLVSAFLALTANSLIRSWSQCWSWYSLASETKILKSFVAGVEEGKSLAADTPQTPLKPNTWKTVSRGRRLQRAEGQVSSEYWITAVLPQPLCTPRDDPHPGAYLQDSSIWSV